LLAYEAMFLGTASIERASKRPQSTRTSIEMPFFEKARPTFRVERLSCSGQRESATAHKLSNRLAKAALDRQPRFRNDDGESAGRARLLGVGFQ
jgi:hypothetical protein